MKIVYHLTQWNFALLCPFRLIQQLKFHWPSPHGRLLTNFRGREGQNLQRRHKTLWKFKFEEFLNENQIFRGRGTCICTPKEDQRTSFYFWKKPWSPSNQGLKLSDFIFLLWRSWKFHNWGGTRLISLAKIR